METQTETSDKQNDIPMKSKKKKEMGEINKDILTLASRGSAIIAEILRLKDYIPESYTNPIEEKKYADIIFDFKYFQKNNTKLYDERINKDMALRQKDVDFSENNLDIIERFFQLFSSVYQYITDWEKFIKQIEAQKYIQYTLTTVLTNKDLRHILSECVYNAGVMLLLIDKLIPGPVREKIMVSYYRYKGQTTIEKFKEMVDLFADTKYIPVPNQPNNCKEEKRPNKYPVEYFERTHFSIEPIKAIIAMLKDTDIYNQISSFPKEDHKTHALSNQASMIVILLYFCPESLERDNSKMREIVDKYFNDNWVISFYMGYTLDLNEYWRDFKAARKAIENTLTTDELKMKKKRYIKALIETQKEVNHYINEGIMTEDYVLKNIEKLLSIDRDANVCLKWFILQSTITEKKYKKLIKEEYTDAQIIELLFSISQFEYLLKTMFQNLIDNKDELWNISKNKCKQKLEELIAYFEGKDVFASGMKREDLASFFKTQLERLNNLNYNSPNSTSKKITKIQEHIQGVKGLYQIDESENAKQNVKIIDDSLKHMLRIVQVRKNYLISITKISDFAYAWINIQDYSKEMQTIIKNDSKKVLLLRAAFLKLASILNFPLVRLFEIQSEDIESVTNYYSGELVEFVKQILQIIPSSVFDNLNKVIEVFTKGFKEITLDKIPKEKLESYSQFELRNQLACYTYKISQFTQGILLMEKTLMGVIEVDPKIILEEGIRKELLNKLAYEFHTGIDYSESTNYNTLEEKLKVLNNKRMYIKKSFLYNQDYININGYKIWTEEMHKLMDYYVEIEANQFLQKKIKRYDLEGKSSIPKFAPLRNSQESPTFLGRLTRNIIYLTSTKCSKFYPMNYAWYYNKNEVFGIKMLKKIKDAIGVEGLQGFGKLLTYINYQNILNINNYAKNYLRDNNNSKILKDISNIIGSPFEIPYQNKDLGKQITNILDNINSSFRKELVKRILEIGQIELLRKIQNYSLSVNADVDSYLLSSQIKSLNEINLLIIKNDLKLNFDQNVVQDLEKEKLAKEGFAFNKIQKSPNDIYYQNLCQIFEDFGYVDTQHTFYVDLSNENNLPMLLACCTFLELSNDYKIDKKEGIYNRKPEDFDLFYFTFGIYALLYQTGKNNIIYYISILAKILKLNILNQYSLTALQSSGGNSLEVNKDIAAIQLFLQDFAYNCNIDLDYFGINFNNYLMFRNISDN